MSTMKKLLITLLALCSCLVGLASGDNGKIKINIILSEQSDAVALLRETEYFSTKQARRQYVVESLQRQAKASQADLLNLLEEMEHNGLVEDVRPLWIVNSISCKADGIAIEGLRQRNDILALYHCEETQWLFDDESVPAPRGNGREIAENLLMVNADQVWEQGYTGQEVLIAIIDTGVSLTHADLQGRFWDGGAEYPNHGYDFYSHDNDPTDESGHGTHVAGTICGTGVSGTRTGVAPDAKIMALKVFDSNELTDETVWVEAMQFAVEHGADVLNMSLGRPLPDANVKLMTRQACDNTLAAGVVAAVCAGNVQQMQSIIPIPYNIYSPGDCPPPYLHPEQMVNEGGTSCVVCVGAVDFNGNLAGFSSLGPSVWTDVAQYNDYPYSPGSSMAIGLIRPDVCAPGVNIKSLDYSNNTGYTLKNGTSMATPCVAGTIALMLSKEPELTPAQIDEILERTAVGTRRGNHKDNSFGAGCIDALAAVNAVNYDAVSDLESQQLVVFPNPSTGLVNIQCEGMKRLELISMEGKCIKNLEVNDSSLQIDGLEKGVYLVRVISDEGVTATKVVVL